MELIEVLWKQDVDLGFTIAGAGAKPNVGKVSEEDQEKLKVLESLKEWSSEATATTLKVSYLILLDRHNS